MSPQPSSMLDAVCEAILEVAPDLSRSDLQPSSSLHEDLGLDSIDLVNVAGALTEHTGIAIPEADYGRLTRVADLVDYLENRGSS